MGAETDVSCLSGFKDVNALTNRNRAAAATLVQLGVVKGASGLLMSEKSITRAEFMELLYRIIGTLQSADQLSAAPSGNLILSPAIEDPVESPSPSVSATPVPSPSESVSPSPSVSPGPSVTPTPSPSESVSPAPDESPEPSVTPRRT